MAVQASTSDVKIFIIVLLLFVALWIICYAMSKGILYCFRLQLYPNCSPFLSLYVVLNHAFYMQEDWWPYQMHVPVICEYVIMQDIWQTIPYSSCQATNVSD